MSFDTRERSNYDGGPTTLYEFSIGGQYWRYAAGESAVTVGGATYTPLAIQNEGFSSSGNPETDEMTVRLSAYAPVVSLFASTPPSDPLSLRIRTIHGGDTETPAVWSGQVKSGKQVSTVEYVFSCNSLLSSLNRNGLRLSWGRGCPHALYDRGCRVNPSSYAVVFQVSAVTGNTVINNGLAFFPDGYFAGGFMVFTSTTGTTERRAIKSHYGANAVLLGPSDGISVGMWAAICPGCDRTSITCESKFNNLDNYGGFPHLPTKSPFDGDPIF